MNRYKRLLPAVIWCLLIWTVSSLPSRNLPSLGTMGFDKLAHLGEYTILGFLVKQGLKNFKLHWTQMLLLYTLLMLLATTDEFHQSYIPGRSVSAYDQLANILGITIGLFIKWPKL